MNPALHRRPEEVPNLEEALGPEGCDQPGALLLALDSHDDGPRCKRFRLHRDREIPRPAPDPFDGLRLGPHDVEAQPGQGFGAGLRARATPHDEGGRLHRDRLLQPGLSEPGPGHRRSHQAHRLGRGRRRVVSVDEGTLLADVDELQPRISQQVPLAAHPLGGATVADLVEGAAGAGRQDDVPQAPLGDGPLDGLCPRLVAGEGDLLYQRHARKVFQRLPHDRQIHHVADLIAAATEEDSHFRGN